MADQKTKTVKIRISTETGDDLARLSQLFAGTNTAIEKLDDNTVKLTTTLNSLNVSAARSKESLKLREALEPNVVLLEKAEQQIVSMRRAMDTLAKKGALEPNRFDEYNNSANLLFQRIKEIQTEMEKLRAGAVNSLSGLMVGGSGSAAAKTNSSVLTNPGSAGYDPLVSQTVRLQELQSNLNSEVSKGTITTERAQQLYGIYAKRIVEVTQAQEKALVAEKATGFSRNQTLQLNAAAINSFQALAAGISPAQVALMEGAQFVGAFAQESKGLSEIMQRLFTPAGLAVTGVIAGIGLAVVATTSRIMDMAHQIRLFDVQLKASGLKGSSSDLYATALGAVGPGQSRSEALSGAQQLLRSGISNTNIQQRILQLAPNLSAVTGDDLSGSVEKLAAFFTKGASAVEELDNKIHFLTISQRLQIDEMKRAGDQVGVYKLALDSLSVAVQDAAQKSETEWKKLARTVGEAWDEVLESSAGKINKLGGLLGNTFGGHVTEAIKNSKDKAVPSVTLVPSGDGKTFLPKPGANAPEVKPVPTVKPEDFVNRDAAIYIEKQRREYERLTQALAGTNLQRQRAIILMKAEDEIAEKNINRDNGDANKLKKYRIDAFNAQLAAQARDAAQQAAIETAGTLAMAEAAKNGARAVEEANIQMKASIELLQNDQQSREQVIQRLREQADAQRALNTEQEKASMLQKTIAASFKGVALGGSADLLQKEIQRLQGIISQGGAGLGAANSNAPIQLHPSSSYSHVTGAPAGTVAGKVFSYAQAAGFDPGLALATAGIESGMGYGYEQTGRVKSHTSPGGGTSRYQGVFQLDMNKYHHDMGDIDSQIKDGIASLKKTYEDLKSALKREPEKWEVYLAHQQGVAGAVALIDAAMTGGSSRGAIAKFYKDGGNAAISGNTISGYKGDTLSAAGFNSMWQNRFDREYSKYAGVTSGVPIGGEAANQNAAGVVTNVTNQLDALKKQLKDNQEAYDALTSVQKQFSSGQIDVNKAVKDASEITEAYNMVQKNTNLTFAEALEAVKKLAGAEGFSGLKEAIASAKEETALAAQELAIIQSNGFNQRAADDQIALLRKGAAYKQQFPGQDVTPLLEQVRIQQQIDHEIEKQKAGYQELTSFAEGLTDRLGDGLLNAFKGGEEGMKAFGDLAKSVLQDILNEVLKLAVVNPIKNWLSGGNAPTLDSIFGSSGIGGSKSGNGVGLDSIFDFGKKGFDLFNSGSSGPGFLDKGGWLDQNIGTALGFSSGLAAPIAATSGISTGLSIGAGSFAEAGLSAASFTPGLAATAAPGLALSSVIPVVGAGIGLLGGLFGGLFGSKKPSLDPGFKEISNRLNSYLADKTPIGYGEDTYGKIYEGQTAPGGMLNWDEKGFKSAADVDKAVERVKQMIDAFVAFDQKLKDIVDDRSDLERYIDNLTKELYKQKEVAAQLHIGTGQLLEDFDKAMEHIQTEFKDKWLVNLAGLTDPFAGQLEDLEKQRKQALRDNTATGANIAEQIGKYFDEMEKRLKEDQEMSKRESSDSLEIRKLAAANENEVQRALIQFDLNAAKERLSAARSSAVNIVDLEKTLADERLKILKDFGTQIQDALDLQRISNRPTVEQLDYYQGKYNEALSSQDVTSSIKYFQNVTGLLAQLYEGTVLEADATKEARDKLSSLGKGLGLPGFASGGSFTVPAGFGSDNVVPLFRVSSGERVSITPSTSTMGSDREMAKLVLQLLNSNQDIAQQLQMLNTTSRDVKRQNSRVLAKVGSK